MSDLRPYETYKESNISWLGRIPQSWHLLPGKRHLRTHKEVVGDRHPNFDRLSLTMKGVLPRSKMSTEGLSPESFATYQILRPDELVFKMIDLENRSTSRVGLSGNTGLVSSAYIVASTSDDWLPRFAYYYYMSLYLQGIYNELGSGVRSTLNADDIRDIPIVIPPLGEQKNIIEYLDRETSQIDEFIANQEDLVSLLNERRTASITRIVTQGMDPAVPKKDSGIKWLERVPHHWEVQRFGSLYRESDERLGHRRELELLSVSIHHGVVPWRTMFDKLPRAEEFSGYKCVKPGDIVLNRMRAFQGGLGVAYQAGIVSPDYLVARLEPKAIPDYWALLMKTPWFVANMSARLRGIGGESGGAVRTPRINQSDLSRIEVAVPPTGEQAQIADHVTQQLDEVDAALRDAREAISLSRERRAALISAAVTGRIDVRNWTGLKERALEAHGIA